MKKFKSLLVLLVVLATLVGCGKTQELVEETDGKIVVTDIAGREVEIQGPVKRVIVNNRSAFDTIFALVGDEAADMIVGVPGGSRGIESFNNTYGVKYPKVMEIEQISAGGGNGEYDNEKIISLKPDVLIMINQEPTQNFENLQTVMEAGIPVVGLSYNIEPLRDRVKNIEILGKVFGKEERAKEMSEFMTRQYDLVEERLKDIAEEDRKEVHQTHFHGDTPKTFWSWSIISETAGGKEIANDVMGEKLENGGTLDTEYLLKKDPEVFIIGADGLGLGGSEEEGQKYIQEMIAKTPGWKDLTAVKNKNTYGISYSSALNMETFYANLQLAKWYYPEKFEDVNPDQVLKDFYDKFMPFEYEGDWSTKLK